MNTDAPTDREAPATGLAIRPQTVADAVQREPGSRQKGAPFLAVDGLRVEAISPRGREELVAEVSFEIHPGEMVGLVGDSGSGKTMTALAVMDLLPAGVEVAGGKVVVEGVGDLGRLKARERRRARGTLAMIFQEPRTALNPLYTIGFQIGESLRRQGLRGGEARRRGIELLDRVALPDAAARWRAYPQELSGGQCQRVMLAMALAAAPRLLIADEPTTALDVSVQAQVLELLAELRREFGLAIVLITHDLAVVAATCDRLLVMDRGRLVESGSVLEVFEDPRAETTRRMLAASAPASWEVAAEGTSAHGFGA